MSPLALLLHLITKTLGIILVQLSGHDRDEIKELIVTALKYGPLSRDDIIAEVYNLSRGQFAVPPLAMTIHLSELILDMVVRARFVTEPVERKQMIVLFELRGNRKPKRREQTRTDPVLNPAALPT